MRSCSCNTTGHDFSCGIAALFLALYHMKNAPVCKGPNSHSYTRDNFFFRWEPIISIALERWRKPEYPEETHAGTGRTCKLNSRQVVSWLGFKPVTLFTAMRKCYSLHHCAAPCQRSAEAPPTWGGWMQSNDAIEPGRMVSAVIMPRPAHGRV